MINRGRSFLMLGLMPGLLVFCALFFLGVASAQAQSADINQLLEQYQEQAGALSTTAELLPGERINIPPNEGGFVAVLTFCGTPFTRNKAMFRVTHGKVPNGHDMYVDEGGLFVAAGNKMRLDKIAQKNGTTTAVVSLVQQ